MRTASISRKTNETDINLALTILPLGTKGSFKGKTGIGFFDHMLNAFCSHGGFDVTLGISGDLDVDGHHTVEDVGIVMGTALKQASGDMKGITRFADIHLPMDEALVLCAVDFSGRAYLAFDAEFKADTVGAYDTQLTVEFMRALAFNAGVTLHLKKLCGENDHHVTEALYKAAGKCIGKALEIKSSEIMSTKGLL